MNSLIFSALIAICTAKPYNPGHYGGYGHGYNSHAFAYGHPTTALNVLHGHHATPVSHASYAAPVAHAAYAAPVAHAAYAAPVAHASYAAPVAHAAYAGPVAHASYAAPVAHAAHGIAHAGVYEDLVDHHSAAVAVPSLGSSQYQAQDEYGNIAFGYQNVNSARQESGNTHGVTGSYSYVDQAGQHTVNYVADDYGYRII